MRREHTLLATQPSSQTIPRVIDTPGIIGTLLSVNNGRTYPLGPLSVVGRNPSCDIPVDDSRVSLRHCEISRDVHDGEVVCTAVDLSTNGSFLNSKKMTRGRSYRLRSGDELSLVHVAGKKRERTEGHEATAFHSFVQTFVFQCQARMNSVLSDIPSQRSQKVEHIQRLMKSGSSFDATAAETERDFQKGEFIAQGAFGSVYLGLDSTTGALIAIKEVPLDGDRVLDPSVVNELNILRHVRHRRIVQFLGCKTHEDHISILLEYVPGGSIASLVKQFGAFSPSVVRLYTSQILQGLECLHALGIAHGDIKPGNVLVSDRGTVKLNDFGTSRVIKRVSNRGVMSQGSGAGSQPPEAEPKVSRRGLQGTPLYMSPEMIRDGASSTEADVWAVGCLVLEMATGKPPWSERSFDSVVQAIYHIGTSMQPPSFQELDAASPLLRDFVERCCAVDPSDRPTVAELCQHQYILAGTVGAALTESKCSEASNQPASIAQDEEEEIIPAAGEKAPGVGPVTPTSQRAEPVVASEHVEFLSRSMSQLDKGIKDLLSKQRDRSSTPDTARRRK